MPYSISEDGGPPLTTKEIRTATLLNELPFLVPFQERVMMFQTIILKDKMEYQGEAVRFLQGPRIELSIRRNYLYEDAFERLSVENGNFLVNTFFSRINNFRLSIFDIPNTFFLFV